jgi:integrase
MADRRRTGALAVRTQGAGLVFTGRWRDDARGHVERTLGPAWLAVPESDDAKPGGQVVGRWIERRGRLRDGALSVAGARDRLREVVAEWEAGTPAAQRGEHRGLLFDEAVAEWPLERKAVSGWKPTTERNYRAMLASADATPRRRGGPPRARIMRTFGGREIASITANDIRRFLRDLDADERISSRTVNAYRALLHMIFALAVEEGWCDVNPVLRTQKRREADPAELIVYTHEQLLAIVRAAADPTIGCVVFTAATTGLRMGELLELRWRDVNFAGRAIHVQRSYAAGLGVTSPKGRRGRSLPLADVTAQALARLGQRDAFIRPGDLVFPNELGEHLDPSTVRSAYIDARDSVRFDDPDVPALRFHDLRHCFGSRCAAAGIDVVTIQFWMGHANINTTRRYMHFSPRPDDADRLSRVFAGDGVNGAGAQALAR